LGEIVTDIRNQDMTENLNWRQLVLPHCHTVSK